MSSNLEAPVLESTTRERDTWVEHGARAWVKGCTGKEPRQ